MINLDKLVDFAPPGIRQMLLSLTVLIGLFVWSDSKAQTALSTNQDLHAAMTTASSEATALGKPENSDERLNGEPVTIKPPTIEQRRTMLSNFEKMRKLLAEMGADPSATPEYKEKCLEVAQLYNEAQDKYLRWCQAQDSYEPFRQWIGFGYVICAGSMMWGFIHWLWSKRLPKKRSNLILPG